MVIERPENSAILKTGTAAILIKHPGGDMSVKLAAEFARRRANREVQTVN